ncbi:HAD family hydrolase [Paraglaciecola sp. 2405UD69-4]|uniref:HAD family hydrolase n=1 Tax=Paraglaciecola sp. 2405UD69-4 TaxID=3391836 RepID=UPI0039C9C0C5
MLDSKYDAILFDKDGTIFDSERMACDAWMNTAKVFDVPFTLDTYKTFIGVPTPACFKTAKGLFGDKVCMDDFIAEYRRYMAASKLQGVPIKKGFTDFFNTLKAANFPVGVVTSSSYDAAMGSFQHTDLLPQLDVLVTLDDVINPKPAADCYLLACEKLSVAPQRVLVFEDSSVGIKASLAAGCNTIAIPDLADIEPQLLSKCLDVLASFDEANKLLK